MKEREVAVVVGVGPGLGWALVKRFAAAGMQVAMAARGKERLEALLQREPLTGVRSYPCDATDAGAVAALFDQVERELGPPDLVVFNVGAYRPGGILEIDPADFERCWRIGCLGGFLVGQAAARGMVERGRGTILFTGATASLRGSSGFANLAVPKFGLRALAQSMARELGPKGIHVAHVVIDGQIRSERYEHLLAQRGPDALLEPEAIAEAYYQLHRQPRSAWTQELDLRPWVERF
ncbi:SDR family NAD(P)-dependent oxidoreductase [Pelomicrobium sp. G1]|uniref:SDR family NAD(P)-dependent oxidoreductase n=1 Tax=unclassified Pelomicrobium TaxID=2815318 RepID=UPI003F771D1E